MSSHHFHAVVWIDHREARIFHFNVEEADKGKNPHGRSQADGHEAKPGEQDQHESRY